MNENSFKLSQRLVNVASYLPEGATFADIGSDHAYLPCYVCLKDQTAAAIAGEVNQGPFETAKKNVRKNGLEYRVEVRLGNGLEVLKHANEVKQIVIAGMGGALIAQILEEGKGKLTGVTRIIAQPNIDARQVREWLHQHGFQLSDEQIIDEKGHIYEILVADRQVESPYTDERFNKQLLFGPYLMKNKTEAFYQKWTLEKQKLMSVIHQMKQANELNVKKIEQFTNELKWIEEELTDG